MNTNKHLLLGSVCLFAFGVAGSVMAQASGDRNSIEEPVKVKKTPAINANIAIKTSDEKSTTSAKTGNEDLDDLNATAQEFANKRANVNTTIGLNVGGDEKLDSSSESFLKNLTTCTKFEITSKSTVDTDSKSQKSILGFDESGRCVYREGSTTCRFPKSKLPQVVAYYRKKLSGSINGEYNIGVDMKMPEIKFNEASDDDFDFNLKLELPKIKFDKVKTDIDTLIEESCK